MPPNTEQNGDFSPEDTVPFLADCATQEEILEKIEALVKEFLCGIVGQPPEIGALKLVSRQAKNIRTYAPSTGRSGYALCLGEKLTRKCVMHGQGGNVLSFVRIWRLLELVYKLVQEGKRASQRELFYRLISEVPELFRSQRYVNDTIQGADLVALLQCTRNSFGVLASSRGALVGRLAIRESGCMNVIDCSKLGSSGKAIPGDIGALESWALLSDARYIIIVEKDAVFQRLSEDRLFMMLPCILITAKGFPDLATRAMLRRLHNAFPTLPILGLVDWNPSGLAIILTYKYGSARMGLEAPRYVCDVRWMGIRSGDLSVVSDDKCQPMTERDKQMARNMLVMPILADNAPYKKELTTMLALGKTAEIEAIYEHGYNYLNHLILQKVVHQDYL